MPIQQQLPPMARGGKWLKTPDDRPPFYVTHEAHIKRLMMEEGANVIDDPRDPASFVPASKTPQVAMQVTIAAQQAQINELAAALEKLMAQVAQENKQADATAKHDDGPDNTNEADDRRSVQRNRTISGPGHSR